MLWSRMRDRPGSPGLAEFCYKPSVPPEDPYVCVCLAVRESEISEAIAAGADTVARIGGKCEAGTACQSCHTQLREMLREHAAKQLARSKAPESLRQISLFDDLVDGSRRPIDPSGSHKR
jgi:bacterioferritin-associated ferredoxin